MSTRKTRRNIAACTKKRPSMRVLVKPATTRMVRSAMAAIAAQSAATVRTAIATAMSASNEGKTRMDSPLFEEKPLKVHWPMLQGKGSLCRPKGHGFGTHTRYATKMEEVTCKPCLSLLPKRRAMAPAPETPEAPFQYFEDVGKELELEIEWADKLAEMLRYAFGLVEDDRQHVIAVMGTQITAGDVIKGVLDRHELRRQVRD